MATVVIKTIASSSTARIVSGRIDLADGAWAAATMEPASPPLLCRRAIEINIEQLIFANAPHQRGVPGIRPFLARARVAHHQSQDRQGTRSEVPPKLLAIADEVIVVLFAAVQMSLPGRWCRKRLEISDEQ